MPRFITATRYDDGADLHHAVVESLPADPPAPEPGQIWYDSAANILKYQNDAGPAAVTGGAVESSIYTADSILKADTPGTPVALTVAPSTFVGRAATGAIASLNPTAAKTILGITASDISGLGALAGKNTVTSADIADDTIVDADISSGAAIAVTKIANFDTAVRTSTLNQMAAPTAPLSLNSQTITNLGAPGNPTDAATKAYVDSKGVVFPSNTGWAVQAGYTTDKAFNPEDTTVTELARVVGTLIDGLKAAAIIGS